MENELLAAGFSRMDFQLAEGTYENIDPSKKSFAFNDKTIELDPDLMYVKFILCHEGENANGDYFTKEVLQAAQFTPRFKPVDWEHGQPMIGTMLDSVYREDASGRGYIEAVGVVWKFIYPQLSEDIKKKSATGELRLSMECYYREANYKVGDNFYSQAEAEKLGIIPYVGRDYMSQHVTRVFKEVVFGGVGVVANPADKEAVFLAVAKDLRSHGINVSPEKQEIESITKLVADSINRNVNDFSSKRPSEEVVNAVAIAKFVKAFDKAKSSVVSKFNRDEVKTKDQLVGEVKGILNTFLTEIASISNDYYKGVASEEIKAEATDMFFYEIEQKIANSIYSHYQSFSETLEAYLVGVKEDYFIYELYDYSLAYPDSIKLFKGYYTIADDGEITVQFEKSLQVERTVTYTEKASEDFEKEDLLVSVENNADNTVIATEDTVIDAVVVAEENKCCDNSPACDCSVDYKAKASDLEAQITDLTSKLEEATTAKAGLETRIAELEGKLGEIEADKVAQARKSELEGLGIVLSEARQAKLKGMSDVDYADFKELLVEVAGKKTETVVASEETVEEVEEASASEEVVEEITVENTATASLSFESETPVVVKPFGHLSV